MSFQVKGKIESIDATISGVAKSSGKEWSKSAFVLTTDELYNNKYYITVFGKEKVDNFVKFNKVGSNVIVDFNVNTTDFKGKLYTELTMWKAFADTAAPNGGTGAAVGTPDLPF